MQEGCLSCAFAMECIVCGRELYTKSMRRCRRCGVVYRVTGPTMPVYNRRNRWFVRTPQAALPGLKDCPDFPKTQDTCDACLDKAKIRSREYRLRRKQEGGTHA